MIQGAVVLGGFVFVIIAAGANDKGILAAAGQGNGSSTAERHFDVKTKLAVFANGPVGNKAAGNGVQRTVYVADTNIGQGGDHCIAEPVAVGLQTGQITVHILHDGAVGIMVQAVHAGSADGAVGQDAVPALPNGGGAQLYRIHPTGEAAAEQQVAGQIIQTVLGQHGTHQRCAGKTAADFKAIETHTAQELLD